MTRRVFSFLAAAFLAVFLESFALAAPAVLTPVELRCEGRAYPSGIDFTQPALAWKVQTTNTSLRSLSQHAWRCGNGTLELYVVVPPNTTATVFVPTTKPAAVQEGGRTARRSKGVMLVRAGAERVVYTVGSGEYRFTVPE